jgi:hypothetical protein
MRIFYEAGAAAPAGGATSLSMQEVRDRARNQEPPIVTVVNPPIVGGDGKPVIPVLGGETGPTGPAPAGATGPDNSATGYTGPSSQDGATGAAGATGATGSNEPPVQLTDEEFVANFWKTVDEKSGKPVKVEYPVGVDPLSPDGVYIRELAVREDAAREFEQRIRDVNPRGYAYLVHLQNGGTDAEFLGQGVGLSLPERSVIESQLDAQIMIIKQNMGAKGVEDEYVTAIIEKATKDNKLKEMSLKAYDEIAAEHATNLKNVELEAKRKEEAAQATGQAFNRSVEASLTNMRFVVPDTDKPGFKEYIDQNVQISNGKLYLVQPLETESLSQQMEAMYLMYKKGDLTKIVQKQAATQTSQRLRTQIDNTKNNTPKSGEDARPATEKVTFGELWKNRAARLAQQ